MACGLSAQEHSAGLGWGNRHTVPQKTANLPSDCAIEITLLNRNGSRSVSWENSEHPQARLTQAIPCLGNAIPSRPLFSVMVKIRDRSHMTLIGITTITTAPIFFDHFCYIFFSKATLRNKCATFHLIVDKPRRWTRGSHCHGPFECLPLTCARVRRSGHGDQIFTKPRTQKNLTKKTRKLIYQQLKSHLGNRVDKHERGALQ